VRVVSAANLVEIKLDDTQRSSLLDRARHSAVVEWFGRKVEIRSNQRFEVEALRRRYLQFLTAGSPDLIVCAVATDNEEATIFAHPGNAFRYPDLLQRPRLLAFLTDAVMQHEFFSKSPSLVSFHAAALRIGNAALAISATSTGGKSTTAFACVRRGMELYTDERCVVIEGQVHPFPRAVNLRAGGIELLTAEHVPDDGGIADALRPYAGKNLEAAQFCEILGDRSLPQPAKLESIFFITGRSHAPSVRLLDLGPALQQLFDAALCGPAPGMDRLATATALLRDARAYELTLGAPDDTALVIAAAASRRRPLFAVASR
jgi:hypothetical protein